MAWPTPSARTKTWGTEILTAVDLDGQFDVLHTYNNDELNGTTGHGHTGGTNDGPKIPINTSLTIASQAQGDIIYASSSTVFARLGAGTAGQVLTTQGAAANPTWAAAPFLPNNIQVFTSSGTWPKPAGVTSVYVKVIGRGGNGAAGSASGAAGGGGGGYAEGIIAVTGNVTVTIGATNSFAGSTTIQATSGSNASTATGGAGGVGSNGTINLTGATGQGGNGLGTINSMGGNGGGSAMGPGGGGGAWNGGAAANGGSYGGGGGGGGNSSGSAGTGDAGAVIVYY